MAHIGDNVRGVILCIYFTDSSKKGRKNVVPWDLKRESIVADIDVGRFCICGSNAHMDNSHVRISCEQGLLYRFGRSQSGDFLAVLFFSFAPDSRCRDAWQEYTKDKGTNGGDRARKKSAKAEVYFKQGKDPLDRDQSIVRLSGDSRHRAAFDEFAVHNVEIVLFDRRKTHAYVIYRCRTRFVGRLCIFFARTFQVVQVP